MRAAHQVKILACIGLILLGCKPLWSSNQGKLRKQAQEINRPLSPPEKEWIDSISNIRMMAVPVQIGPWRLREKGSELAPGADLNHGNLILGYRFRFLYESDHGGQALIFHFINPVRLRYDDIGFGAFTYYSYFYPERVLFDEPGSYIFTCSKVQGTYELASINEKDAKWVKETNLAEAMAFKGSRWSVHKHGRDDQMHEVSAHLAFKARDWRRMNYGESWLVLAPSAEDAKLLITEHHRVIRVK
jgi:hypothetical protein